MSDWVGNKKSMFTTLGASSHALGERQMDDYYATDPETLYPLLQNEQFNDKIWECSCGEGHLSKAMTAYGFDVYSTDLIDRGFGDGVMDFLKSRIEWNGDIITNPPYKYAQEFVEKSISILQDGGKVAMFLKIQFLEGQKRRKLFDKYPPKVVYVFSKRQNCAKNGDFDSYPSSAICYCWYIWEKGFSGDTIIKWI